MDLELSDEQLSLQESVRDFLAAECPIGFVRRVADEGTGSQELWSKMTELDWPAMTVGEAEGGLGLGFVELAVVAEELGRAVDPTPFMATAVQFASALRLAASPEQRARFLEPVAKRGMVGTLALAEEGASFDPADVETEAVPDAGDYVLSGEKHYVFDGSAAEEIVVVARIAGRADEGGGLALFVVPQEEVKSLPMEMLDPVRKYAIVVLDGARVTQDRRLGSVSSAPSVLTRLLEESTAALAAETVGTCQAMFDIVHNYVREREQFGVKIGSFQAIKHKLSDMYVALESARAVSYFASLCIAEDDDRRSVAVSMAKSASADCQKLLGQQSIQTLGGIGYTWEHDIHFYVKRAKASAALFGTGSEHRERVAAHIGLGPSAGSAA